MTIIYGNRMHHTLVHTVHNIAGHGKFLQVWDINHAYLLQCGFRHAAEEESV